MWTEVLKVMFTVDQYEPYHLEVSLVLSAMLHREDRWSRLQIPSAMHLVRHFRCHGSTIRHTDIGCHRLNHCMYLPSHPFFHSYPLPRSILRV